MKRSTPLRMTVRALVAAWCLAGCALVRPVERRPLLPSPALYAPDPQRASLLSGEQEIEPPTSGMSRVDQGGPWWTAFADPELDALIREAVRNNYGIRDLRTLIYENELEPSIPRGLWWPLQVGVPATLQRFTTALPPGTSVSAAAADVGVSASYQLDVWGQLDLQRRLGDELVEQQRQNTERAAHTLALQVAQLWFEILEQRAQRSLLEAQVRYSENLLTLVKARFEQHLVTRLVVLQQEQQLLDTRAKLPLISAQLALLNSRLTATLGRAPTLKSELVPLTRTLPGLPSAPDIGVPSDLLQNSPDLRFAQSRVSEAELLVSQNLASWLPAISLFGNAGVITYNFSQNVVTNSLGVRLTWPIFDGGQRLRRARQLALTVQRRHWQYQGAFNDAIHRVQDALIQEHKQGDHLQTLRTEVALGERVLHEARSLFEQGLSDYLPVLSALANLSSLERAALQAQKLLLNHRIQLYQALGGTWSADATKL